MTASVVSGPTPESNRPPAKYSQSPRKAKVRRFEAALQASLHAETGPRAGSSPAPQQAIRLPPGVTQQQSRSGTSMAGRFVQRPRSCTTPARSSLAVAEEAGIDSIATYLWAIPQRTFQ